MGEQQEKKPVKRICAGLLAHVDAGKTTLSEAMLYTAGAIRRLGRVDKGDAFLDTYELEKKRGITIFSKQARLSWGGMELTLLDTPGHVDFSAEMERVLQVLDYAILVVSGPDGVQAHTRTLWRLLARYQVPVFLFVNKMDLAPDRKDALLEELRERLDGSCVDFGAAGTDAFYENVAVCGEEALEEFLETGALEEAVIRRLIRTRALFPCFFGSALRLEGVEELMRGLERWMEAPAYPPEFSARVFKIARDAQGNRLTYFKMTGGRLRVRDLVGEEKVTQLRLYSGERFETVQEVEAGMVCAATGLLKTHPGEGLGAGAQAMLPVLEPVLTYRVILPEDTDAAAMLPKLLQLEEEEPQLHIVWEEEKKEIHVQLMGEIQMEILRTLVLERFGVSIRFGERSIVYKETIADTVEGVGHFEPLRHYAEVHLLLEPGERGSGLSFATACSEDTLSRNWQRLILTHLEEKEHRGVLIGAPVTDLRITLMSGRAHIKHTEGGDFRQAVYRAVRQGLMQAESVLLEPYYAFRLEIPERFLGRAMTDLERRDASLDPPLIEEGRAILCGSAPVSTLDGYQTEVTAYTGGQGQLTCSLKEYGPCHNADEVIEAAGYDPDADLRNPSGSVFCAHGAGFVVNWDEVPDYMHLESCLDGKKRETDASFPGARGSDGSGGRPSGREEVWLGVEEVDAIVAGASSANRKNKDAPRSRYGIRAKKPVRREDSSARVIRAPKKKETEIRRPYLLVDGYNIIFAWEELRKLAEINIDSARDQLLDILCDYQGARGMELIVVFDAYRVQGHATEILNYHNIHVVFTKEAETADQYIEKFAHENGVRYAVTVATSDRLEQIIIRGQGCVLLSARELEEEIGRAKTALQAEYRPQEGGRRYLLDEVSGEELEKLRREEEPGKREK